jgi:DNA-binding MarR family transcriptional regulator
MGSGNRSDDAFFAEFASTDAALRQAFAEHVGLSAGRVQVLVRLSREGQLRHSDLRERLGVDGATITRLVKRLESDGLLRREPDPVDNRYTLAVLTPTGKRTAAQVEQAHALFQQQLLAGVTSCDRQAVLRVFRHPTTPPII